MPVRPTYPGVYIEEIPSGPRTITGVATSITAFLGRASEGPADEPVTINSFGDCQRRFGGLAADYPMSYAVRDFFLNGGAQAIIARLYRPPADSDGVARRTVGDLELRAANPGDWGNTLSVKIDHPAVEVVQEIANQYGVQATRFFNLTIIRSSPSEGQEVFFNVSREEAGPHRVDRALEQGSRWVQVENLGGAGRPPEGTNAFADGDDGRALRPDEYTGDQDQKIGLYALEKADLFNLLCIPPDTRGGDTDAAVYDEALNYCVSRRAMLIVDPPTAWAAQNGVVSNPANALGTLDLTGPRARNAAVFFPRVKQGDPERNGQADVFVPCGIIAGVMARTDAQRGVWKAPAGIDAALNGVQELSVSLTDAENGQLNPAGINCLRTFPIYGHVVWGSRTMRGADQLADEYKYIPVRRMALFLEESLFRGTKWVVFEPNDELLWSQIRLNIGAFLHSLFRQGAFAGLTPRDAYFVKCDKETTTQDDVNRGIVNILVGFAPLKPAEFVIIKIQQISRPLAT